MAKTKYKPLERQPVILSLLILVQMGIVEEQHGNFPDFWQPLWKAIIAYRDSMKPEKWTTAILEALADGDAGFDKTPEWRQLNQVLNEIWALCNPAKETP